MRLCVDFQFGREQILILLGSNEEKNITSFEFYHHRETFEARMKKSVSGPLSFGRLSSNGEAAKEFEKYLYKNENNC